MARYDIESFLVDLKAISVADLNDKLAAIDAEKNDGVTLAQVDSDAYFFQSLANSDAAARNIFMYYGIDDPEADAIGPSTLESVTVYFIVVLRETAEGDLYSTRLLRYSRALKEIFEAAYSKNRLKAKMLVTSLTPVSFQLANVAGSFRGVGVKIKTVFG